ncbi:MAG TPA: nucleotidyltransferase domain-containing protein [Acidobacteriaceae bacterium]|nr:nucleotidyltransferase domain-containing protein [Acidobacteriaceae bacterium]
MQDFITSRREEIAALCRKHHVRRLAIFGSAVRDDFDLARSDVDVLVEFDEFPIELYFDNKSDLRESLVALFGRKVDLLTWKSLVNPYLLQEIESTRELLYAA